MRSDGPPRHERRPGGSIVDEVEPRIRELLRAYPTMPATGIAERIGVDAFDPGALGPGGGVAGGLSAAGPGGPHPPARFPARKSIEEFDCDHARSAKRDTSSRLGTLDFVTARENVVFLGPSDTSKTHRAIGLAIRACQPDTVSCFATASKWVARLADAHHAGLLQGELVRLGRSPLLVVDEVGYIPFEPEAANLFFQLVRWRYERASLIVTSNKPFGRWGQVFGDDMVAGAMIDRLVHHAKVVALKGDSYRLKDRDLGRVPTVATDER
jgi:DNA replication protein DnaC